MTEAAELSEKEEGDRIYFSKCPRRVGDDRGRSNVT